MSPALMCVCVIQVQNRAGWLMTRGSLNCIVPPQNELGEGFKSPDSKTRVQICKTAKNT